MINWKCFFFVAFVLFGYETLFSFKSACRKIYDSVIEANAKNIYTADEERMNDKTTGEEIH